MIRAYSQRLLPPFSGTVQIAESTRARAQSFDGVSWEIQYLSGNEQSDNQQPRVKGYALDCGFYRVANVHNKELKAYQVPTCLEPDQVADCINELYAYLSTAQVPFPPADIFEYWLLDASDESPLALIFSCCEESQMATYPASIEWTALPHSKMKIDNTAGEQSVNEAPVNHRFQRLIAEQSGPNPRAAWFKRNQDDHGDFPSLLVRDVWQDSVQSDLSQRYLQRKAPRLLMLHGLSEVEREHLEIAAKEHALEVDQYFALYPEVNDENRMSAIRIEARLRQSAPQQPKHDDKGSATDRTMSKDMRIFET